MSENPVIQDRESVGALRLMLRKGYSQEQIVSAYERLLGQEAELMADSLDELRRHYGKLHALLYEVPGDGS
jgi:hypothetical protein